MKIYEAEQRKRNLIAELLKLWEASVKSTHDFLSDAQINDIKKYALQALSGVKHLIVAKNACDKAVAFMGIEGDRLEMLFVLPNEIGKGIGKRLIQYGIENYKIKEVTVNEQNPRAVGFYKHMGFETYKRTNCDEQGNPYPILCMRLMR